MRLTCMSATCPWSRYRGDVNGGMGMMSLYLKTDKLYGDKNTKLGAHLGTCVAKKL